MAAQLQLGSNVRVIMIMSMRANAHDRLRSMYRVTSKPVRGVR